MKALIKKDLYFLLNSKPLLLNLIICIVIILIVATKNPSFSVGFANSYIVFISYIIVSNTIAYDEENNSMTYLMSMAISKKTYVDGKYLLSVVTAILGGILITLVYIAIFLISNENPYPLDNDQLLSTVQIIAKLFLIVICSTSLSLVFNSITLPSFLKYGSKKGLYISFIGFIIIGAIIVGLGKLLSQFNFNIDSIISTSKSQYIITLSCMCIIFSVMCMSISYLLSQRIMAKKEF